MLHQIAFSGATPEHQTPVVHAQPRAQPSSRPQTQGHPASSSKSTPGGQATLGKAADKTPAVQKQEPPAPQPGSLKLEESRGASTAGNAPSAESKTGGVGVVADEKKKYEAMGARPKVLGNLQPLAGKGVGLIEDEKSAKHRARSILASAIPVSPVSSGPPTPCGPSLTRSPSTPNMPKGYMPITSTILTPINFRQPFVAHKRPSTMKQITQAVQAASQASSSARARSETSPSGTGVRPDSSSAQSPPVSGLSSALAQPHGEALLPAHARSDSSPAAIGLSFPAGGGGASQAPGAKLDGEAPSVSGKGEGGVSPPASTNAQSGVEEVPSGSSKVENSGGKEAAAPAKGGVNTAAAADNAPKKTQSAASSAATESSNSAANNHASKPSNSSSPPKTVVTSDNTKVTTTGNTTSAPSSAAKTASSSATAASSTNTKSVASSTKAAASNNTKVTTSSNSTVTTSSNTTGVASKNTTVASSNSTTTSTSVTTTTARNSTASTSSKVTTAAPSRTTAVTNSQNTSATTSRSTPGTSTAVAAVPNKTTTVNSSKAGASTKNTATKTAASSNPSSAADNTTVIAKASAGTVNKAAATSAGAANPPSAGPAAAPNASAANGLPKTGAASASSTAFASITVTTTAAGTAGAHPTSSASTYSSATSSRSSSPGVSLTTFGLNSEGRGIPGAIFFALRPEQNGIRSPQPCPSSRGTSASSVKSPTPDSVSAGQSYRQTLPPSGVKSPPILEHPASNVVKEEHWWSVESPGRSSTPGRQQGGKLVNSTWVRLMGGQANNRQSSGLPWRTARAVSGQQLDQARRASHEDSTSGPTSPNSMSSTATFNYTPAVNSPPSSNLSSATNSAATSPLPAVNQRPCEDLRSMASKNISSAIMSYELGNKCEPLGSPVGWAPRVAGQGPDAAKAAPANDGVATMTRRDLVCPSCQMLFPPEKHLQFLDHFESSSSSPSSSSSSSSPLIFLFAFSPFSSSSIAPSTPRLHPH
nr:putative GPI-anchored protein pfl2 [Penaeus vannamei]